MKSRLYAVTSTILLPLLFLIAFTVTSFAQSFPVCQTLTTSDRRSYRICLDNVTYGKGESTWTYTYRTLQGTAISHLTFGIPCGTAAVNYSSASGGGCNVIYGSDPTTGVTGIKFEDCNTETSSGITISFTIKGAYTIGSITLGLKTGGNPNNFRFSIPGPSCVVNTSRKIGIRVLLQGALVNERCEPPTVNIMRNVLQQRGLLPTTNPYGLPQTYASINSTTGLAGAVTDWVRVELRDGNNPANILESQAGLLKTNGQVVNANGQPLTFTSTTNPVYLVVRHRNHVPISSPEIDLADGDTYDFTKDLDKAYSTIGYPMAQVNEEYAMWGGDVNGDGKVLNTATPSDVNAIKNRVLTHPNNRGFFGSGPVSNYTGINRAYEAFDVNLDGLVYDNANPSDANLVSFIILKHPGNTGVSNGFSNLIAQLPFYTGTLLASSDHAIQSTNVKTEATAWNVIKVYPNPIYTDHAMLELNSLEKEADAQLMVMNINGQIIHSQRITLEKGANQVRMETAHLPQGTYWLKIIDAAQSFPVIKIIRMSN